MRTAYRSYPDPVKWLTSSRVDVKMAAVCSGSGFDYLEFMVKFHDENDLSGAFLRPHSAFPRSTEFEHP